MPDNNKRKVLYEQLTKDGYDLGSYDSFSSNLNNETKRKNLYDAITADNYDVGDYNTFSRKLDENQEGSVVNQVIAEYDQSANQMTDPVARMHQLINENKKENRPSLRQKVKDMSVPSVPESPSVPSYSDMVGSEQRNYTPQIREPLKKDVAKELEEKELDVNFKAKPVAEDTDIFDNYMGRFGNTKRGIELNAELADVQSEFEKKYFDEFKRTSEYENILKGEYRTQEEADEANRKLNELFNQKYVETIKKEMAPYYAAYQEEMFDRYGYNINKEMLELNKKNTSSQINGLEKEVGRLLDEKHALLRRRGGSSGNAFNAIMGSGRYNFDSGVASQRQEIGALEASQRLLEQSQEIIAEAAKKGKTNFFGGFGRGLRDNFDWENFTFGLAEMADAKYLNNALEKAERGEALTSAEEKLLEASVANMATQAYFGSDLGRGYGAGQTTAVSLPFMLEFIANPISSSGNAIAKGLLKFGMKRFGRKAMEKGTSKFATRLLGDAVAAVGMEGTTGVPGVSAGTLERLNENYKYGFDDNGVMQVEKVGDKSFGSALAGSSASRFFENQSEMIFNAFKGWSPLMKAADNSLPGGVSEFMNRIKNSKVGTLYRELVSNPTFREIANRAQFHGLPEEYMEEVYNNLANAAIGEMSMDDVVDLDNNIDTFLGLAPTSVMFAAIGLGGMAYERLASRKRMERLFGHFTDEQKRKFEELQRMSKETGNRDIREFIKATMADESLSQEERRSEIEYAFELAKQNAIDEVQNEQPEEVQAAEAAYDEGTYMPPEQHYSAEQEKMMAGDALRNAEPGLFNVVNSILENGGKVEELKEMLTGASDEVGALALDYYYKAQRIEGVIDAGVEDAMNAGDEFERSIQDAIVTDDNGNRTITTATYRDEQVYVLADDGVHATILRDGKKEMVGSDRLSDIQQSDADVVIDEAKNQYLQQKQESLNNSINHHPKTQMPQVGMQLWSGDTPFVVTAVSPDGVVQALPSEFDSKTGQIVPKKEGMVNMSIEEAKNLQDEYYNRMDAASVQDAADAGQVADSGSTTEKILADGRRAVQTNTDGKEVSYNVLDRDGNMVDSGEMPSEEFASLRDYVPEGSENGKKEIVFSDPRTMSEEERQRRGEMLRNAVVTDVESGVITSTKEMTARKAAEKWWDENVQEPAFYDTEIGEVEINRNSVESSLAHRYGQKKLDSITSLVDGFENAVYLGTMPDSRERGVVDHYFAYPIRYDGELNYVFCRVMQDANKNRLYVHEVFVADNIKKGDTLQTAASKPHGGISIYKDILANVLETVNNNDSLHPTAQEEKPVSLGETNGPTDDGNQPALLGINSPAVSESKDSELSAEKQEGNVNNLIPVDEKGSPIYHKAPLDATISDLTDGNLTDEEIDIFIANYQKKAKEELEKIKGKAPKIGLDKAKYISEKKAWQAKVDEAQAKVDYWEQVQNIINESRVQSVEKPAEEVVNESMQEKEIQENANSIKGDMADEGKKSGEVTETEISAEVEERIDNEGVPAQEEAEAAEVKEDVIPSTKPVVYEQFKQDRIKEKLPEEYKSVQEWKEKSQNTYYEAVQSIYHEYQQYIESFGKGEQERVELPDKAVEKAQKVLDDIAEERKKVDESPTDAQKEAGNYKKGHVSVDSYNITIENPKGSERSGTDANGERWSVTMNNDYGYIRGTEGVDGDHIDVFLSDNPTQGNVYVIDQINPDTGKFDEHKVMYGFSSMDEATAAYFANYSPGWKGLGTISEVSKEEFKKWIESSHRKTKPFAEYKNVKVEAAQGENQVSVVPANEDIFQMAERVVNENKEKPKEENDILFRKVDASDENKTLVGLHNISSEKLRKALRLGGFANPSAAVIDISKQSHEGYGEISLVLPSSMIDKRTGRNAGTFENDAWTPVYPQVERKFSDNGYERASKDIQSVPKEMQTEVRRGINSWLDGRDARELAYLFLHEIGEAPEMSFVESKYSDDTRNEIIESTGGSFSLWGLDSNAKNKIVDVYVKEKFNGDRKAYESSLQQRVELMKNNLNHPRALFRKRAQEYLDGINESGFDYDAVSKFVRSVEDDVKYGGKVNDSGTTLSAISRIEERGLKNEFEKWIDGLNDRYDIQEVIFNGFTPSGDRKYIANTLENVSAFMKKSGRNASTGISSGFNRFAASVLKAKGTLKDIRKGKNKLTVNHDEVDAFRDKWSDVFYELGKKLQPGARDYEDYGMERLLEAAGSKNPQKYIKDEYGIDFSDEDMQKLNDMISAIRNEYPSMYFETKFERPVYLNEFAAAVVPDNVDADIMKALKDSGLNIVTYKHGDNTDRKRALDEAATDDVLFREPDEVNRKFNKEIDRYKNGEMKTSDNGKVSVEEAVSLVRKFKETVPGSPEIAVISSEEDIDRLNVGEITKGELKRALNNPKVTGCYSNRAKMVFTFPSHASGVSDFEDTLSHEVAHYVSRSVELSEELKESVLEYVKEQHPDVYSKVMSYPETDRSEEAIAYLFEKKCREFGVDRVLKSKFAGDRDVANVFTEITKFLNHEKGRERNQLRGKERNRKTGNESSAGTENAVHDGRGVRGDDLFRESDTGGRGRTGAGERGEEETGSQTDFALREAATGIDANGREDVKSIEFNPATDNIIEFAERVVAFNSSRKRREEEDKEGMRFRMSESGAQVDPLVEIRALNSRIASLEKTVSRLKDQEEIRRSVTEFIRKEVKSELVGYLDKQDLNSLLVQAQNAKSRKSLEKIAMNVKNVVLNAQRRKLQRVMDRLLSLKVQDVNGKNMSIAKNVDDSTRKIFSFLRGRVSNLALSGFEDEMKYLRRKIREKKQEADRLANLLETAKKEDRNELTEKIASLSAEMDELKTKLDGVKEESESVKEQILNQGDLDVEAETERLEEKLEMAAMGKDVWTQGDTERMAALNILGAILTNKKHEGEIEAIGIDRQKLILNNSDLYRNRIGKNETVRSMLTAQINENNRRIVAYDRLVNDIRLMQVKQMEMTIEQLGELISNGKNSLLRRLEEEYSRKRELVSKSIRSVEGNPIDIFKENQDKENAVQKFFFAPLGSFEYMCRTLNTKTLGKDGYLYKRFISGNEGVLKAYDTYVEGMKEFRTKLNDKCKEIFGKDFEKIASLSDKVVEKSGVYIAQSEDESAGGYGVKYELPLTKGQAMYIYQVWKMNDGRTKLELQGFDEESIEQIKDFIGPEYVKFADWVQDEFLQELREKYNEKYLSMYNTSLAEIEHYIPLKIRKEAIRQEVSMSEGDKKKRTLEEKAGSLINRTANTYPVDITRSGFEVLLEHGNQMEEWNAYARVRKDLDYVLSSTFFRNQLNANSKGSFDKFRDAAEVATKSNHPDRAKFMDEVLGKLSKGVVGGNIAFRLNTALKQVLSAPAFLGYAQHPYYIGRLLKGLFTPYSSFKWCMENIPSFYERVNSGTIGNEKLDEKGFSKMMDRYIEVGMIPNKLVDAITCSLGAKAIYDYKKEQLMKAGVPEEEAHNQAKTEADIYYNGTQQSSHPAFLSPMQMSRTLVDRMLTTYQNSNIGYVRRMMESLLELVRSLKWKELKANYTKMYMEEGLSAEKAESKAYQRLLNENKKNVVELLLFGWGLNLLWNIGSQGLLGFFRGDDDDDDELTKDLAFFLTSPVKGMPGGNLLESMANGYGMNPFLVYDELDKFMRESKNAIEKYGIISPEIAYITLAKASRYAGVDLEVWGNIYMGVEGMARDGALSDDKLIDIMYMLNSPKSGRETVAKELYKDESLEQFAEKITRALKYVPKENAYEIWVPGAKQLTKKKEKEIKKEAKILQMSSEERERHEKLELRKKHLRRMKELKDEPERLKEYKEKYKDEIYL